MTSSFASNKLPNERELLRLLRSAAVEERRTASEAGTKMGLFTSVLIAFWSTFMDVWPFSRNFFGKVGHLFFRNQTMADPKTLQDVTQALLKASWQGRPQRQTLLRVLDAVTDEDLIVRENVAHLLMLGWEVFCRSSAQTNA